jgi:hypothetical protein
VAQGRQVDSVRWIHLEAEESPGSQGVFDPRNLHLALPLQTHRRGTHHQDEARLLADSARPNSAR